MAVLVEQGFWPDCPGRVRIGQGDFRDLQSFRYLIEFLNESLFRDLADIDLVSCFSIK